MWPKPRPADRREREHGQALVMFTLCIVVIMALAGLVIDAGLVRTDTASLQNALDAGALGAAQELPTTSAASAASVTDLAQKFVHINYPAVPAASVSVTYDCLIASVPTTPGAYGPSTSDNTAECPNFPTSGPSWTCNATKSFAPCDPAAAGVPSGKQNCNMIAVAASSTQAYTFSRVIGINSGTVNGNSPGNGVPVSYATNSLVSTTAPVDVALVVDRTQSMSGTDTTNAKAAANAIVPIYNPAIQWLGFGALGPSLSGQPCAAEPDGSIGTASFPADLRRWIPIGLSGAGAAFSQTYTKITSAINCYSNSSTGTDLADPVNAAAYELIHNGRTGVSKGIILETDGQPNTATAATNATNPGNYCAQASTAATNAKNAGLVIFTIGFGLDNADGGDPACPDNSGPWKGKTASQLLASMATQPSSDQYGCSTSANPNTNTDGDHYFCEPKTGAANSVIQAQLTAAFTTAAASLAAGAALVQLPVPPPIITSISPSHGPLAGNTVVTVTGKYFTSAFAASFGGGSVVVNVLSDTTLKITSPAHVAGNVNVTVMNPGGTSNAVVYTYP